MGAQGAAVEVVAPEIEGLCCSGTTYRASGGALFAWLIASIAFAIVFATVGALGRLSRNPIFNGVASFYVSLVRGTPLLLQLLFWWALFRESLPGPREAIRILETFFLSNSSACRLWRT